MLIQEADPLKRKNGAEFIFVSHEKVPVEDSDSILARCTALEGNVFFKLEPLIIHVECETMDLAVSLLHAAKGMPYLKHSSIVSAANRKVIVSIKGMVKLEIPIIYEGKMLVDSSQFRRYIDIANERMEENFEAIRLLQEKLSHGLLQLLTLPIEAGKHVIDWQRVQPVLTRCGKDLEVASLRRIDEINIREKLIVTLGDVTINLNDSMKFGLVDYEKRIGIIPDLGQWPIVGQELICYSPNESFSILSTSGEIWILAITKKPGSGKVEICWKRMQCSGKVSSCYSGEEGAVVFLGMDGYIGEISWEPKMTKKEIIKVKSFKRLGDSIRVNNSLTPEQAEIYANNMRANLIVNREGQILFNRRESTKVHHKEDGVVYIIDFLFDSFGSTLVSARKRLLESVKPTETVVEIAASVDCCAISLAVRNVSKNIFLVVEKKEIRQVIKESVSRNNFSGNFKILSDITELETCVDRLIVSDPSFDLSSDMCRRLVKVGGSVHVRRDRQNQLVGIKDIIELIIL
jgi:tRNA(Phe) wybutosine-synthesizing methylase Tyw3